MNIIAVHDWVMAYSLISRRPWQVHSIYRHTVCLNGPVRLITFSTKGNGPAIVFIKPPLPEFNVGQIIFPQALFDGGGCQLWAPPQYSITKGAQGNFSARQQEVYSYAANSVLLTKRYLDMFERAFAQLAAFFPGVYSGAKLLIGLGPGLTPSGDDFLVGYCHVLCHAGITGLWNQLVYLAERTNRVSGEMLFWACKGTVLSFWEDVLLEAISPSSVKSKTHFKKALSVGSSSGADYLLGCYVGLSLLNDNLADRRPVICPPGSKPGQAGMGEKVLDIYAC